MRIPRKKLVLLPDFNHLDDESRDIVFNAEWYETESGILLADCKEILYLSEDDPLDADITVSKTKLKRVPHALKRGNELDGFYHA